MIRQSDGQLHRTSFSALNLQSSIRPFICKRHILKQFYNNRHPLYYVGKSLREKATYQQSQKQLPPLKWWDHVMDYSGESNLGARSLQKHF